MKPADDSKHQLEFFLPRVLMRKWLNISGKDSDYSADTYVKQGSDTDSDTETFTKSERASTSQVKDSDAGQVEHNDILRRRRRRQSETFRAQYINKKELRETVLIADDSFLSDRICVGTWNVGGKIPPDDLDIETWININESADIYVIGFQEIVPLNAGNIFGAEDSSPVLRWENIIREKLNRVQHKKSKIKCYSDPPSPSRFKPIGDILDVEAELLLSSDSELDEEVHPVNEDLENPDSGGEINNNRLRTLRSVLLSSTSWGATDSFDLAMPTEQDAALKFSSPKKLDRSRLLRTAESYKNAEAAVTQSNLKLRKIVSVSEKITVSEKIGLSWPLDILARHVMEKSRSFKSPEKGSPTEPFLSHDRIVPSELARLAELNLESLLKQKRKSAYMRIVSKQMVGVFLTIWVRRSLHRHIQNVRVATVGVGVMGYIGNKGSISVSMSIYQTLFCFICTHLTSGEKDGDELKRNADVHDILKRTHFQSITSIGLPKSILEHERIIWLGDLNYRINMPHDKTQELISRMEWSKLVENDQLRKELNKGRAFDGWSEGPLKFAPTYKYELDSEYYCGEDSKVGRRNPAWCDRILSYGKGLRLLSYGRNECRFSDHRPVNATYMVEVEEFSPEKLQRALILKDAELNLEKLLTDMDITDVGICNLKTERECVSESDH